eukprot:1295840-Rhodomonas_salina.1
MTTSAATPGAATTTTTRGAMAGESAGSVTASTTATATTQSVGVGVTPIAGGRGNDVDTVSATTPRLHGTLTTSAVPTTAGER